jgi:hypothetical protein
MVMWETMVAVMVHCCGSTSAFLMQIATLLQMASPALLWLAGSGAAAHKGRSRVRHFAMGFASTVVNAAAAAADPVCVSVAPHGCVLCTWLCGIHCVPRRGVTALRGMQHGHGRVVAAAATHSITVAAAAAAAIASTVATVSPASRTAAAGAAIAAVAAGVSTLRSAAAAIATSAHAFAAVSRVHNLLSIA